MSFLKPKFIVFALIFLFVDLLISLYFFVYKPLYDKNTGSPLTSSTLIPAPTAKALSVNDIRSKFFTPGTNTAKELKVYEISIENNQISTNQIIKDNQHDVYFINKDPSIKYLLNIYNGDLLSVSTLLSPKTAYVAPLNQVGSYSYKLMENDQLKFEGKIDVQ